MASKKEIEAAVSEAIIACSKNHEKELARLNASFEREMNNSYEEKRKLYDENIRLRKLIRKLCVHIGRGV